VKETPEEQAARYAALAKRFRPEPEEGVSP
jgi:hypothetical protein